VVGGEAEHLAPPAGILLAADAAGAAADDDDGPLLFVEAERLPPAGLNMVG
jgi:hypothetical protein